MSRLADGDRGAFTAVFQSLWAPALRLCRKMMGNEADAADAAQASLIRILERTSEYDSKRPALPWALAIATWECRTLLKRRARQRLGGDIPAESDGGAAARDREQQDLIAAALTAMGTLSAADQQTLLATYWATAASSAGATLRKRRSRALNRLKAAFGRLYGFD